MPADATARLAGSAVIVPRAIARYRPGVELGVRVARPTRCVFKKKFTMIKCCKDFIYSISGNSMAFMKFKMCMNISILSVSFLH